MSTNERSGLVAEEPPDNPAESIWSVSDLLRGVYKQSEYGKVILPLTFLRRLDCVLDPERNGLANPGQVETSPKDSLPILNSSGLSLATVMEDSSSVLEGLSSYIDGFGTGIRSVFTGFGFLREVHRLHQAHLLEVIISRFLQVDLCASSVSEAEMGHLFEELVRRFADLSGGVDGECFTPRDVVRLVIGLLFEADDQPIAPSGESVSVFDPACGTGGLLTAAEDLVHDYADGTEVELHGQEIDQQVWAVCQAIMALRGRDAANVLLGDSLVDDGHVLSKFDYLVANPPIGLSWTQIRDFITQEHEEMGHSGRFGAGLPRRTDGSFLFLQHIVAKMKPTEEGGSRAAVILNGSSLATGGAGSGESKIRRWIIESDLLDAVVALPDQLLSNTSVPIYVWLLTNRKPEARRGTVQLVDARQSFQRLRKSLGCKRSQITSDQAAAIVRQIRKQIRGRSSRVLPNAAFIHSESERCRIEPWMFIADVNPGTHRPLSELVEFGRRTAQDGGTPILRMENLVEGCQSVEALTERTEGETHLTTCSSGDIVGGMRKWFLLPDRFGSAATNMAVLRPIEASRSNTLLLSQWLASSDCERQQTGFGTLHLSPDIMVPVGLVTNEALATAAAALVQAREESLLLIDSLFPEPLEGRFTPDLEPTSLWTGAATARAVLSLLQPLTDVVQRAELQFPYQIAKLARDYRLAAQPGKRLDAGLLLAESVVRTIGVVAAAALASSDSRQMAPSLNHFSGGISAGSWLQILRDVQKTRALVEYPELEEIGFRNRGLGSLLDECVKTRNQVRHAPGIMTEAEQEDLLSKFEPVLFEVLDRSTWLSQYEFLHVRSCEYVAARHEVNAMRLNGSHPDWQPVVVPVSEPIERNHLYLDTPATSSLLCIHPFALVKTCSECQREELYVLDRIEDGGKGQARSLKNHQVEVDVHS